MSSPTHSIREPLDPVAVVTTDRLDAYYDDGSQPMLNNYTRQVKIGTGHHGEVWLCHQLNPKLPQDHADRRMPVAMKSVKRDNIRAKQFKKLRQQRLPTTAHTPLVDRLGTTEAKIRKEIAIMKKCRHPHVVRLLEIIDDRSKEKIYMVMEYLEGGEVKWHDEHHEPILTYDQTRRIVRDAVLGLEYLHHQGIIHRDIKPANLLYTNNRRQVKIADFGVSHFSYAQRLAAAGGKTVEGGDFADDTEDILLDDSDLTKRAGTPSFLAPEIVYEHTNNPSPGSSSMADVPTGAASSSLAHDMNNNTSSNNVPPRPPITKAIDVWALGVTLYCLLFGKTPFMADPAASGTEWSLYNSICNLDWPSEVTMCSNRVPTGGRHPKDKHSPGGMVMRLLDRLLQKDPKARITLDEIKRHEWILQDIAEPTQWMKLTMPKGKINVSADETSDAMSAIRFQWNWNSVARRVSSLFKRSIRDKDEYGDSRGPVKSDPSLGGGVRRHHSARLPDQGVSFPRQTRKKGKQRAAELRPPTRELAIRPKSTEPWPISGNSAATNWSTSTMPNPNVSAKPSKPRRGSSSVLHRPATAGTITIPTKTSAISISPGTPTTDNAYNSRPRGLLSNFFSIKHWRPNKFSTSSHGSSTTAMSSSFDGHPHGMTSSLHTPSHKNKHKRSATVTRRSEEVLRHYHDGVGMQEDSDGGGLTVDRRASSWGQGDDPSEFAEALSSASSYSFLRANVPGNGTNSFVPSSSRLGATNFNFSSSPGDSSSPTSPRFSQLDDDQDGERERRRSRTFGTAYYDDSSTIASGERRWQEGDSDGEDDRPMRHGYGNGNAQADREGVEGESFEEEEDDDDDDSDQESGVMFSPKKRPPTSLDA
ncbi:hypothetical protein H0H93_014004 [Arthromyces matolae]|nr:hypothetical protein H0H93_014004 [Arthromyces matolae]